MTEKTGFNTSFVVFYHNIKYVQCVGFWKTQKHAELYLMKEFQKYYPKLNETNIQQFKIKCYCCNEGYDKWSDEDWTESRGHDCWCSCHDPYVKCQETILTFDSIFKNDTTAMVKFYQKLLDFEFVFSTYASNKFWIVKIKSVKEYKEYVYKLKYIIDYFDKIYVLKL